MNKEAIIKQYALDQWLSSYKTDNPKLLYDLLISAHTEETLEELADSYELEPWHVLEDHDLSYIASQIVGTYISINNLLRTLENEN